MLFKKLAFLTSTRAFIPLINTLPIAAVPCAIARSGVAHLLLLCELSYLLFLLNVTGLLWIFSILLVRSAGKVMLTFHSSLAFSLVIMSISWK